MHRTVSLTLVSFALTSALSGQPRVSNREPQPDEIGYRPADGAQVRLNPPSLIWLHETNAQSYSAQWARQADFSDAITASNFVWNTYTHHAPLAPGTYHWRYRYTAKDGATSTWSATRTFTVPTDAVEFPMPTRAQQRARVPAGHPRLFLRPEDLPRLRKLAKGREADRFAKLRVEADRILAAGPTPEPTKLGSARNKEDKEAVRYWWPNREQTMKACQEAESIAFVYLLTSEDKYRDAARQWVLHLAGWNPDGPTNFRLNCEAAKPLLYRLPRAYDWAYDALTSDDRAKVRAVMRRRAQDAWESWEVIEGTGHLNRPFGSHANRTWHKLGECAIAFFGEVPEAETWLDYAVNKFYACYPVWADDDGGWHEGASYWAGYMSKAVWWLQVAQSALEIDGLKKPFFAQVGDFPLYVAPPGSPNMGFGDLSHRPPTGGGPFLEYFVRASANRPEGGHAGYWRWYLERCRVGAESGVLGFLYAANLPPLPAPKAPTDLPPSKVFRGIGVASLHLTLLESAEDVHLLFKSSPFGTQSHGHNPHNSFQLNAYGEALLTTCVYRDLHGSKFHYQWAHSTRAHNALLVNGEGQIKHTSAPHGRIVDAKLTPEWDYVVGDATEAYGGRLTRARRHVLLVKSATTGETRSPLIVLYDDLVAKEPSTFQFMLHALKPFTVDEGAARLKVEQSKAGVTARYFSPVALTFRQWDGYEPPPDKEFPNQWHVEAGTRSRQKELGVLTVLVPYRAGREMDWTAERLESATALGVRLVRGGTTRLVAFRKEGASGEAALAELRFNSGVTVR
jgi:hypothetical protein